MPARYVPWFGVWPPGVQAQFSASLAPRGAQKTRTQCAPPWQLATHGIRPAHPSSRTSVKRPTEVRAIERAKGNA